MKRIVIAAIAALTLASAAAQAYSPVEGKMITRWGKEVSPENVWQSYPRPQLVRDQWQNLNGLWEYEVTAKDAKIGSVKFGQEILVPFCIESTLSGVGREFMPEDRLWYKRSFTIDKSWKGKNILLHFGAVDYRCEVFVNGKSVGKHVGGNNSFCFDITKAARIGGSNIVVVSVTDPTSTETATRGKQLLNPRGIWYTPVSGIWKTVWLEPVSATSIRKVVPETKIDGSVKFDVDLRGAKGNETVRIEVKDGSKVLASYEGNAAGAALKIADPELWSPDCPKLYHFDISVLRGKTVLDKASSYFALREVSIVKDVMGNSRFALNGKALFQFGPLDQGWWPDGLLTPPSEEAMIYDLIELKKMGINTVRKHIKVEPELYYYYTDSLGLMMWQDMPSGFIPNQTPNQHVGAWDDHDWPAPAEHEAQWKYEFKEMYENLRFFPSITTWVVFNEGWGQFRTPEITAWVKELDGGAHLINAVTGWTDRKVGDMYDVHNYPSTAMKLKDECDGRISILGEFGGLSLRVEDHLWNPSVGWVPYRSTSASLDLMNGYTRLMYDLEGLVAQGLSGAIYTQTTDVETELNGYITYDRDVVKLSEPTLAVLHSRLYEVEPCTYDVVVKASEKPLVSDIAKGSKVVFNDVVEFKTDYKHLGIWISGNNIVTVYINGNQVFEGAVRQTRNFNHFNLSYAAKYLREGNNTIRFVIEGNDARKNSEFNYFLTAY